MNGFYLSLTLELYLIKHNKNDKQKSKQHRRIGRQKNQ